MRHKEELQSKMVSIAISLNIRDKAFDNLNCIKIDRPYISERYNYDYVKDSREKKLDYFISEIINSDIDVLVGDFCYNLTDLIQVAKLLKKHRLAINMIYIPSEERRIEKLAYGKTLYKYNRWLDFYPGEIEDEYRKFESVIEEIENYYRDTITTIMEV